MTLPTKKRMLMLTDGHCDNASARIRAIQYIPYFEALGFQVTHLPRVPQRSNHLIGKYLISPILKRWFALKIGLAILFGRWDVLFIQRIFIGNFLLKRLTQRSVSLIYDFDDAIYIHPRRPENEEKTAMMVRAATHVIVSTDYLQAFCRRWGKVAEVVPSPVEIDRIYPIEKTPGPMVTIGWMGSSTTSVHLALIERPLQRLASRCSFRFFAVGASSDCKIPGINFEAKPWIFEDENKDIGEMDIGVMPLLDTEYTRMKGGYKLLQYMSAGIPCVASPVGINQSMIKTGENGFLAATEDEWVAVLEALINDRELRIRLGVKGRKLAIELYSREVCFEKLKKILFQ